MATFIWRNSTYKDGDIFLSDVFPAVFNYHDIRLTVDEEPDFKVIEKLVHSLGVEASWIEYTKFYLNSDLFKINSNIKRNEGFEKSLKEEQNG